MISVSLRSSAVAAMAGRFTFAQAALALVIGYPVGRRIDLPKNWSTLLAQGET